MSEVAEKKEGKRGEFRRISRCTQVMEDGRKCKQRPWLGGELCFQHDPETAELRKLAGRPSKKRLTKGQEVEELLDEVMEELRAGRMKPGQAYAVGYLAQLMLSARQARHREVKLDVKWFWDMVDLVLALEDGEKAVKEKKAQEAGSFASQGEAQEKEEKEEREKAGPSTPLGMTTRSEEEDDSGEEAVVS